MTLVRGNKSTERAAARQLRGWDENVHSANANQGRGPVDEQRDRYADMGAGIWRWVAYSLCAFLLFTVVVVASK